MHIGYFNARGFSDIESWFKLEIDELRKRGHKVRIFWLKGNQPTKEDIEWMDISHYHFAQVAEHYKRIGVPYVISPHAHDIFRDDGEILRKASQHRNCKAVTYQSFYHKKKFEEWDIPEPYFHLPMCCRTKLFSRQKKYNPYGHYIAGGRLIPKKGLERLLKRKAGIRVFGDGPMREYLEYTYPNNRFLGHLKGKQLKYLFEKGSIYFFPAIVTPDGDSDGIANTVKEAMLMNLQVITSSVAGMKELENVTLLDDWSKINEVIDSVPKKPNWKGEREILNQFSPELCVNKLLKIVEEVI